MPIASRATTRRRRTASQMARPNMPFETLEHAGSPLLVPVDNNLGVRLRSKAMPLLLEDRAQLLEVVDLPVEDDPRRPIVIRHRLMPAREIDDRETPESEPEWARHEVPSSSGPRCAIDAAIRRITSGSTGCWCWKLNCPAIPHMAKWSLDGAAVLARLACPAAEWLPDDRTRGSGTSGTAPIDASERCPTRPAAAVNGTTRRLSSSS